MESGEEVSTITWRARLTMLTKRYCLYPAPKPMPHTRWFWVATGIVTAAVLLFCVYFIIYLTARQNAFLTNAEDLGTMDQTIWNTVHGQLLHQTVCNIISDTNCYSLRGYNRFAIHFEPILLPISLLYLIWADPKTLVVLQTLVVASGAYPAFWLARLRLHSELAGVMIALLYLLFPAQLQATTYDFHAVTFTAALLLFALYFMYTQRTAWLFIFAILAMACKEEIPLVIAAFGLWSVLFQQRWRSGFLLFLLGISWFGLSFAVIMPHFSPTGHPLLISRYAQLGKPSHFIINTVLHPRTFLRQYILEPEHAAYLKALFAPTRFLPIAGHLPFLFLPFFAPWILIMAGPTLTINLLSSDSQMYSGLFQYNAEIVPVLIFACIEGCVVLLWLLRVSGSWLLIHVQQIQTPNHITSIRWLYAPAGRVYLLALLLTSVLFSTIHSDYYFHGQMPFSIGFSWPDTSAHTELAQNLLAMIPTDASVSAQTRFVPHLSHRKSIYLFPYADNSAEYIFLDATSDIYPFPNFTSYTEEVKRIMLDGHYGIITANNGYLLLKQGLTPPRIASITTIIKTENASNKEALQQPVLPPSFCSNICQVPNGLANMSIALLPLAPTSSTIMDVQARIPLRVIHAPGTVTPSQSTNVLQLMPLTVVD